MSGTEHWLSAADFREANGPALVISSDRKTSSGSLRNHTQLVDLVKKAKQICPESSKYVGTSGEERKKNGRALLWRNEMSKKQVEQWRMKSEIKLVANRAFQVGSKASDIQFRNSSFIFCQWLKVGRWHIRNLRQYTEI